MRNSAAQRKRDPKTAKELVADPDIPASIRSALVDKVMRNNAGEPARWSSAELEQLIKVVLDSEPRAALLSWLPVERLDQVFQGDASLPQALVLKYDRAKDTSLLERLATVGHARVGQELRKWPCYGQGGQGAGALNAALVLARLHGAKFARDLDAFLDRAREERGTWVNYCRTSSGDDPHRERFYEELIEKYDEVHELLHLAQQPREEPKQA